MLELDLEDSPNIITILLMGETGVGKSTFINSLANYIQSDTFDYATKTKPTLVIPTKVTIYDEDEMEDVTFNVGTDDNEVEEVDASATQNVKAYIFPVEGRNLILRIIDTPGLGDDRGIDQDDKNTESILSFLAKLKKINAICLLMKPSNERNIALFSYCVRRILSQLHKSAADNVIFLFTNTKGSDYRPGATMPILKKTIEEIANEPPHVKIPANKANVFCLENECFKNLLALSKGIGLSERTIDSCKTSWKLSCKEIIRLIDYVQQLPPHNIQETVSFNRTKDLILQLSKPIADITQHLHNNVYILKTKEAESKLKYQQLKELEAVIQKLWEEKNELEKERFTLNLCAEKFAFFLQNNAIILSYDYFTNYIKLALEREKKLGHNANMEIITSLTNTLEKHEMLEKILNQTCSLNDDKTVTSENLFKSAKRLFELKHSGPKIKEIVEASEACIATTTTSSCKNIFIEKIPNWFFKGSKK